MQDIKAWPKLSNYSRRSQKLYSINCGQYGPVNKAKIRSFIHSCYTFSSWCVFLKHKIQCWPTFILHLLLIWTLLPNLTFYLIVQGFHRTYATGAACQQRTLTPPDTWSCPTLGLACVLMSRPISPELVLSPDFWISNTPRYFSFAPPIEWQYVVGIPTIHLVSKI